MSNTGNGEMDDGKLLPINKQLLEFLQVDGALAIFKPHGKEYFIPIYDFDEDNAFSISITPFEEDEFLLLSDALKYTSETAFEGENLLY